MRTTPFCPPSHDVKAQTACRSVDFSARPWFNAGRLTLSMYVEERRKNEGAEKILRK